MVALAERCSNGGGILYGGISFRSDTGPNKEADTESVYSISCNFKTDETLTLRELDKVCLREFRTYS